MREPHYKCSDCKQILPASAFGVNRARKTGLHYMCRPCNRAYAHRYRARENTTLKIRQRWLNEIKAATGCYFCGMVEPKSLDFHHRDPDKKNFELSDFPVRPKLTMEQGVDEILLCEVVCKNHHPLIHSGDLAITPKLYQRINTREVVTEDTLLRFIRK